MSGFNPFQSPSVDTARKAPSTDTPETGPTSAVASWLGPWLAPGKNRPAVDPAIYGIAPDDVGMDVGTTNLAQGTSTAKNAADGESTEVGDVKDSVTQGFIWLSEEATAGIDTFEREVAAEDPPSLIDALVVAAIRTALSGATSGVSQLIAGALIDASAAALTELVKSTIEIGVGEGVAVGANAVKTSKKDALGAFADAQRAATRKAYRVAQSEWLKRGRHSVRTPAQWQALDAAFSGEQVVQAGAKHYDAARDAWITYLAQAKFGVTKDERGNARTDMTSEDDREKNPERHRTEDGPSHTRAWLGVNDGVLSVRVTLPEIMEYQGLQAMPGKVTVIDAYLNGVNEKIRAQFVGKPISKANVPRQIHCEGEAEFIVSIDEGGNVSGDISNPWLAKRARVGRPQMLAVEGPALYRAGIEALMGDVIPSRISKGTSE